MCGETVQKPNGHKLYKRSRYDKNLGKHSVLIGAYIFIHNVHRFSAGVMQPEYTQ